METTQETNELVLLVETSGLEKTKGNQIAESLSSFFTKASEWNKTIESIVITNPSEVGKMKMAKEGRLYLKNLRLEGEKIVEAKRKDIKARMADDVLEDKLWLKAGQMMEATFKNLEGKLEEKEKFAERFEAERKAKLREERIELLNPYQEFVPFGIESSLGEMTEEDFEKVINGAKLQLQAKKDAEKKAEQERVAKEKAEAEEREKIKKENERLKLEAEEREKAQKEEEKRREKVRKEMEALQSKRLSELLPYTTAYTDNGKVNMATLWDLTEKDFQTILSNRKTKFEEMEEKKKALTAQAAKEEALAKVAAKKLQAEQDAKLKKEREEREKAEAELKSKKEAEEKAKQEEAAKAEAELSKGDKEKFSSMMQDLEMLKYKYSFKSAKYKKLQTSVNELLDKTINYGMTKTS